MIKSSKSYAISSCNFRKLIVARMSDLLLGEQKHRRCKVRRPSERSRSLQQRLLGTGLATFRYLCFCVRALAYIMQPIYDSLD